jgi:hypothetical protein
MRIQLHFPLVYRPTQVTPSNTPLISLSSYYCPIQVTPSYTPFTFPLFFDPIHLLFVLRCLLVSSSKPQAHQLTLYFLVLPGLLESLHFTIYAFLFTRNSIPSLFHYLCPELRPSAHHGLHAAPAYIQLSLLRTPLICAPRFTRSSLLHHDFLSTPTLRLEQSAIRNVVLSRLNDTYVWFIHDLSHAFFRLKTFYDSDTL